MPPKIEDTITSVEQLRCLGLSAPPAKKRSALLSIYKFLLTIPYFNGFAMCLELLWMTIISIPDCFVGLYRKLMPAAQKEVRGLNVLVTGTANGLGRGMVLELAQLGCNVICVDIDEQGNKETVSMMSQTSGCTTKHRQYTCDVSDAPSVRKMSEQVLADVGRIDILINNAAYIRSHGVLDEEDGFYQKVLNINVLSHFWMIRCFLPSMIQQGSGHIVAMSSMSGFFGLENLSSYCTSKFAISGLMCSLREELRLQGQEFIKLTCVHPYFVDTNPVYTKNLELRIPPLEPLAAVRQIVTGIRQELPSFSVPDLFILSSGIAKLVPHAMFQRFRNVIQCRIHIDTEFNNKLKAVKEGKILNLDNHTRRVILSDINSK